MPPLLAARVRVAVLHLDAARSRGHFVDGVRVKSRAAAEKDMPKQLPLGDVPRNGAASHRDRPASQRTRRPASHRSTVAALPENRQAPSSFPGQRLVPDHSKVHIRRAISSAKLVVRSGASLGSKKLCELERGSHVLMLEQVGLESGDVRARVGRDSTPRGLCVNPVGWVTARKDGESKLVTMDDRRLNPGECDPSFSRMQQDSSMASRIAKQRRARQSQSKVGRDHLETTDAAAVDESDGGGDAQSNASGSTNTTPLGARLKAKRASVGRASNLPLLSPRNLHARADEFFERATAEEAKSFHPLQAKLYRLIVERGLTCARLFPCRARGGARCTRATLLIVMRGVHNLAVCAISRRAQGGRPFCRMGSE